jgi:hypothetical protein
MEHNGLAAAPVFIEDLDAVLGGNGTHVMVPLLRGAAT